MLRKWLVPLALCALLPAAALAETRYPYHAAQLWRDAEKALAVAPVSVVDKQQTPPSGDKHDYMSIAIYWWPDESKPDGLPWVNRDGHRNPLVDEIPDKPNMNRMRSAVETLSLAWAHSGEQRYAEHAALLLRAWFLDPATRMNPHLQYAQGIPGRRDGGPTGIIDTAQLGNICDCAELLRSSAAWTEDNHRALQAWFQAYIDWLRESPNGIAEGLMPNNHGVWYDAQVVRYALFVGETNYARAVCERALAMRIAPQIAPGGSQPHELKRTKSWHYSIYNLQAFVRLAELAREVDVDLWRAETKDGRSIVAALEFLRGYANKHYFENGSSWASHDNAVWPYPELEPLSFAPLGQMLITAGEALGDRGLSMNGIGMAQGREDWLGKLRVAPDAL